MNMEIMPLFPQETPALSMFPTYQSPTSPAPVDSLKFAAVLAAMQDALQESGLLPAIPTAETPEADTSASAPGNAPEPDSEEAAAPAITAADAGHWVAAAAMTMGNVPMMDMPESGAWLVTVIASATARSPGAIDFPMKGNASLLAALSFLGLNAASQSGGNVGSAASELNANMPGPVPPASDVPQALDIGAQSSALPSPMSVATSAASAAGAATVPDAAPPTQAADLSPPGTTPPETAEPLLVRATTRGVDAQLPPPEGASHSVASPSLRITAASGRGADMPEGVVIGVQETDAVDVSLKAGLPGHEKRFTLQEDHPPGVKDAVSLRSESAPEAARAGASAASTSWVSGAARDVAPAVAESPVRTQIHVVMESIGAAALRSVRYLTSKDGDRSLTVRFVPESLGEMRVEVRAQGEEMLVRIVSANPLVRESIQAQVHELRQSLAREGIEVTRVDIAANMSQDAGQGGRHPQGAVPQPLRWASSGRMPYDGAQETAAEHARGCGRPHHGVLNVLV